MTETEAREIVERYKTLIQYVAGDHAPALCALPVDFQGDFVNVERTLPDYSDGLPLVYGSGRVGDIFTETAP